MHLLKEVHPTKELQDFIKQLIETKSKEEEDKIIRAQLEEIKILTAQRGLSNAKQTEYCIKALYAEMLGHDASFAHIFAIKMIENKSLLVKKIGYLASALMLAPESDLKILLVASIQRDLASRNESEVLAALNAVTKLVNSSFAPVLTPSVLTLVDHKNSLLRKKALIAMQRIEQLVPGSVPLYFEKVKKALLDQEPSVVNAALNLLLEDCPKHRESLSKLLQPLCQILKQVTEKRLGYYDYQKIPEPYMQIKILKIIAILARNDRKLSTEAYPVIEKALGRADNLTTDVSYAVVFECVLTICALYYEKTLVTMASTAVIRFLNPASSNSNMVYMGINALRHLSEVEPGVIQEHQVFVLGCLESADESIRRITLDLLCKNTKASNLQVVAAKLLKSMVTTADKQFKGDLARQVFDLAVRYSTDFRWFVESVAILLRNASENFSETMLSATVRVFEENFRDDPDSGRHLLETLYKLLEGGSVSDEAIRLLAWSIGNIELRLSNPFVGLEQAFQSLKTLLEHQVAREETKIWVLDALFNLSRTDKFAEFDELITLVKPYENSQVSEIRLRVFELQRLGSAYPRFNYTPVEFDPELPFLFDFMNSKKGKFYSIEIAERISGAKITAKPMMNLKTANEEKVSELGPKNNDKAGLDGSETLLITSMANSKWTLDGYQKDTKEPKVSNLPNKSAQGDNIFKNMETKRPKAVNDTAVLAKTDGEEDLFAELNLNRRGKQAKPAEKLFSSKEEDFDLFTADKTQRTTAKPKIEPQNSVKQTSQVKQSDDFDLLGLGNSGQKPTQSAPTTLSQQPQTEDDLDFLMGTNSNHQSHRTSFRPLTLSEEDYEILWEELSHEKKGQVKYGADLKGFISQLGFYLVSQIDEDHISAAQGPADQKILLYLKRIGKDRAEFIAKSNDAQSLKTLITFF